MYVNFCNFVISVFLLFWMKLREYKIVRVYFFCYDIFYILNEKYKLVFKLKKNVYITIL